MADLITIKKWDRTAVAGSGWVTFKDEDFGNPEIIKHIYSFILTYKLSVSTTKISLLNYSINGAASTWLTTNLTDGAVAQAATDWDVTKISFADGSPAAVQSIRIRLLVASKLFQIKDLTIEYRPIYLRAS